MRQKKDSASIFGLKVEWSTAFILAVAAVAIFALSQNGYFGPEKVVIINQTQSLTAAPVMNYCLLECPKGYLQRAYPTCTCYQEEDDTDDTAEDCNDLCGGAYTYGRSVADYTACTDDEAPIIGIDGTTCCCGGLPQKQCGSEATDADAFNGAYDAWSEEEGDSPESCANYATAQCAAQAKYPVLELKNGCCYYDCLDGYDYCYWYKEFYDYTYISWQSSDAACDYKSNMSCTQFFNGLESHEWLDEGDCCLYNCIA